MELTVAEVEWDDGNGGKCQKHGVPLAAIENLFRRPLAVFPDPLHSGAEERFKAIGVRDDGRGVFIVFTLRNRGDGIVIRPPSARFMHRKEVEHYEKAAAAAGERSGR